MIMLDRSVYKKCVSGKKQKVKCPDPIFIFLIHHFLKINYKLTFESVYKQ